MLKIKVSKVTNTYVVHAERCSEMLISFKSVKLKYKRKTTHFTEN